MKLHQTLHVAITLSLLMVLLVAGALIATGVIEIRIANDRAVDHGAEGRAKGRLVVVRGAKPNTEYRLYEGQNMIGRADEKPVDIDLEIQESADRIWSSRQHAVITWDSGSFFIEDLKSSNGTFVNRNRIQPGHRQPLHANDIIQVGEVQLKVVF